MLWGDEKRLCLLYALTPVHAGAGQALKAIDLPIQRERHTAWPMVQASGVKGALRDWCERAWENNGVDGDVVDRLFGKAGERESWAGAVTVTDARLLLFPVRSNVAPFVHVTCPAVLKRLREDLTLLGDELSLSSKPEAPEQFISLCGDLPEELILEDMLVQKGRGSEATQANWFEENVPAATQIVLISDEVFGYLVRTATEIQAHIAIDDATGTAKDGSLRYQEYLPADSVLYFLAFFANERSTRDSFKSAREVAQLVTEAVSSHIQIGGDFTLGKGICQVRWIAPNGAPGGTR